MYFLRFYFNLLQMEDILHKQLFFQICISVNVCCEPHNLLLDEPQASKILIQILKRCCHLIFTRQTRAFVGSTLSLRCSQIQEKIGFIEPGSHAESQCGANKIFYWNVVVPLEIYLTFDVCSLCNLFCPFIWCMMFSKTLWALWCNIETKFLFI